MVFTAPQAMKGTEVSAWLETQLNQLEIGVSIYTVARLKFKPVRDDVFDKSFLETICEKSTGSMLTMFNNGKSKHRLVTFKEKNLSTRSIT